MSVWKAYLFDFHSSFECGLMYAEDLAMAMVVMRSDVCKQVVLGSMVVQRREARRRSEARCLKGSRARDMCPRALASESLGAASAAAGSCL
jgi:hypothetical protein